MGWEDGADGGSPILSYRIARDGDLVGNATAPPFNDTDVPLGSHNYTVVAVNAIGAGPASVPAAVTVDGSESNAPVPGLEVVLLLIAGAGVARWRRGQAR